MRNILCVLSVAFLLGACASGATVGGMTAHNRDGATTPSALRGVIVVGTVKGGESTNPMWVSKVDNNSFRAALEGSLTQHQMIAPGPAAAKYRLSATLMSLEQPLAGLDMTVHSRVKYTLQEVRTGKTVYEELVGVPFTAKFSSTYLGVERLRLANEGSIRTNIGKMIMSLKQRAPSFIAALALKALADLTPARVWARR